MTALATTVPGPDPYLSTPGGASTQWPLWKTCFDNYIISIGGDAWSDKRKTATILSKAGLEAQRLYYATHTSDATMPPSYAEVEQRLSTLFSPKINPIVAIHMFRQRLQMPGEPISDFFAALKVLAPPCKFGLLEDQMLLSQILEGTTLNRIKERLLMEPDLTLTRGLEIARQIETAIRDAKTLSGAPSVNRTQISTRQPQRYQRQRPAPVNTSTCKFCGKSPSHRYTECPARGKACHFCRKLGHFEHMCLSKKSGARPLQPRTHPQTTQNRLQNPPRREQGQLRTLESIDYHSCDTTEVQTLHTSTTLSKHIPCSLKLWDPTQGIGKHYTFIYDPGSPVSTLPKGWYQNYFGGTPLHATTLKLKNYDKTDIHIEGCLTLYASFKGRTTEVTLYVVNQPSGLLGLDVIRPLNINLDASTLSLHQTSSSAQQSPIESLQQQFPTLLSPHLGLAKGFVHKIQIKPQAVPVQKRKKPVPLAFRQAVSDELKRLVQDKIIEPIEVSEWCHPMSVIKKADGRVRITCDLRGLNPYVIADKYPLPKIEELLSQIRDATVLSKLDLAKAFFQVLLDPESRPLTAFQTDQSLFQYCRLPMGLISSPSVYQRITDTVTDGLVNVIAYMDDIIVWGKDQASHDANLKALLNRLQQYNMRLEPTKCNISKKQVQFLGHVITAQGIQPLEKNTAAILNAPPPKTYKALHAFMGSCSFNLSFLPNFALLSEPLWDKLRGNEKSEQQLPSWTASENQAFESIKKLMCKPPVLGFFRTDCPTTIVTDASEYGLGATMYQNQNGALRLIRCISHTLTESERKYHIGEKEALACVWACERWHYYLFGRPFTLVTDHKALETLLDTSTVGRKSARIARWYERLSRYNYKPVYRSGDVNRTADFLSRLPVNDKNPVPDHDDVILATVCTDAVSLDTIAHETRKSPQLSKVTECLETRWPPNPTTELQAFFNIKDELSLWKGCILRGEHRIIIPDTLSRRILNIAHEAHPGTTKMKRNIREMYWWPTMDRQITEYVKHCEPCQASDKSKKSQDYPGPSITSDKPWHTLCMDIAGPFAIAPTAERYIIALTDIYSRWVEAASTSVITSKGVSEFLDSVFSRFGLPTRLITDNGPQFTSHEFESYLKQHGISHSLTALYNPQANSPVERVNRWIKEGLQVANLSGTPWRKALSQLLLLHRASAHSSTGVSPAELHLGRKIRTKLHVPSLERVKLDHYPPKLPQEVNEPTQDRKSPYKVGDYVRHKLAQVPKGKPSFSQPLKIISAKGRWTYELENHTVWNARKLRRANQPSVAPTETQYAESMPRAAEQPARMPTAPPIPEVVQQQQPRPRTPPPGPARPVRERRQRQVYQHFPDDRTQRQYQCPHLISQEEDVVTTDTLKTTLFYNQNYIE